MATRNQEFASNMSRILQRCKDKQDRIVRAVAAELISGMKEMSPVDTGRFKNNWYASIGQVDTTTNTETVDQVMVRATPVLEKFRSGMKIYLTNSLPYAKPLEFGQFGKPPGSANGPKTVDGYSKQAPGGMVRLTVQNYNIKLREIVQQLENT